MFTIGPKGPNRREEIFIHQASTVVFSVMVLPDTEAKNLVFVKEILVRYHCY